jgi:hypothetical protein
MNYPETLRTRGYAITLATPLSIALTLVCNVTKRLMNRREHAGTQITPAIQLSIVLTLVYTVTKRFMNENAIPFDFILHSN